MGGGATGSGNISTNSNGFITDGNLYQQYRRASGSGYQVYQVFCRQNQLSEEKREKSLK
ncbi:MAG TPA: hypothetical protein VF571_05500 [Pyrinomonadaceae bacterium]